MASSKTKEREIDFSNPTNEELRLLEREFSRYFKNCDLENAVKIVKPYTVSGLLYSAHISKEDFASLSSGDGEGARLAKRALLRIEAFIEENALNGKLSSNAAMNTLKNGFGTAEKDECVGENITVTLDGSAELLGE